MGGNAESLGTLLGFALCTLGLLVPACAGVWTAAPRDARATAQGTLWAVALRFVPPEVDVVRGRGDIEGWYDGSKEWAACRGLRGPTNHWLDWAIDRRQRPLPMDHDHTGYAKLMLGPGLGTRAYLECLQRGNPAEYGAIRALAETEAEIGGDVLDDALGLPIFYAPHPGVIVHLDARDDARRRAWLLERMRERRATVAPEIWQLLAETDLGAWSWQAEKGHQRFTKDPKADPWNPRDTDQPMLPAILSDRVESLVTLHPRRPATSGLREKWLVTRRYRFASVSDAELAGGQFHRIFTALERVRRGSDEAGRTLRLRLSGRGDIRTTIHGQDVRIEAADDTEDLEALLDMVLRSPLDAKVDWEKVLRKQFGPRDYD